MSLTEREKQGGGLFIDFVQQVGESFFEAEERKAF